MLKEIIVHVYRYKIIYKLHQENKILHHIHSGNIIIPECNLKIFKY